MWPPPPRWVGWALTVLLIAGLALIGCLFAASLVTDTALRDALGVTYVVGTYFVVAPAFVAVCLVAITVRVWRHFKRQS